MADDDISRRLGSVESKVASLDATFKAEVESLKASIAELTKKVDGGASVPFVNWELGVLKVKFKVKGDGTLYRSDWTVIHPTKTSRNLKEITKAALTLKETAVELFLGLCRLNADPQTFVYPSILDENQMENYRALSDTTLQPVPLTVLAVGWRKKRGVLWTCISENQDGKYGSLCAHGFRDERIVEIRKQASKTFKTAIESVLGGSGEFLVPNDPGQESFASRFKDSSIDPDEWVDKFVPELKYLGAESGVVCINQLNEYMKVSPDSSMPRALVKVFSGMYEDYLSMFRLPCSKKNEKIEYLYLWYHEACYRLIVNGISDGTIVLLSESDKVIEPNDVVLHQLSQWIEQLVSERSVIFQSVMDQYDEEYVHSDDESGKLSVELSFATIKVSNYLTFTFVNAECEEGSSEANRKSK